MRPLTLPAQTSHFLNGLQPALPQASLQFQSDGGKSLVLDANNTSLFKASLTAALTPLSQGQESRWQDTSWDLLTRGSAQRRMEFVQWQALDSRIASSKEVYINLRRPLSEGLDADVTVSLKNNHRRQTVRVTEEGPATISHVFELNGELSQIGSDLGFDTQGRFYEVGVGLASAIYARLNDGEIDFRAFSLKIVPRDPATPLDRIANKQQYRTTTNQVGIGPMGLEIPSRLDLPENLDDNHSFELASLADCYGGPCLKIEGSYSRLLRLELRGRSAAFRGAELFTSGGFAEI